MGKIKEPAIFLAQFYREGKPFNSLESISKWAASLGYRGIQVPAWIPNVIDLKKASESQAYCDEYRQTLDRAGGGLRRVS